MSNTVNLSEEDKEKIRKIKQIGEEAVEELTKIYKKLHDSTRIHLIKKPQIFK